MYEGLTTLLNEIKTDSIGAWIVDKENDGSPEHPIQFPVVLHNCYWNSLELAKKHDVHSIAFPAISTGVYGYPLLEAVIIAIKAVKDWLEQNQNYDMRVVFSCFDDRTFNFYREELGIGD